MCERGLGRGELCRGHLSHHPVKIIAPFAAGGPSDIIARILADKLSASLNQQFYVEDHAGAGGNIGMTQVARSAPDGYTILVASSSFIVNPSLYAHNPYDPYKDFVPVTLAVDWPNVLFVASLRSGQDGEGIDRADEGRSRQIPHRQFRVSAPRPCWPPNCSS